MLVGAMVQKRLIAAALTLIALAGLWLLGALGGSENEARHTIHKTLEDLGFVGPLVPTGIGGSGGYTYKNIKFDPDEFGRIREARITPPGPLSFGRDRFQQAEIDGLRLTGVLTEDGVSLSGLMEGNMAETPEGFLRVLNIADVIVLNKARLDVFSETLGGIGFETTAELRRNGNTLKVMGDIRSVQKQLSLEGKLSGSISLEDGSWEFALAIEQGKAALEGLALNRLYGEASLTGRSWSLDALYGQTTAGNMVFHGYAFQAPSFTFERREGVLKVLAEAKDKPEGPQDADDLEFGFLYSSANPGKVQVSVFSSDIPNLLDYLRLPADTDTAPVKAFKNLTLTLESPLLAAEAEEIRIPFIIKTQDSAPEESGFAVIEQNKNKKSAKLKNIFWNDRL